MGNKGIKEEENEEDRSGNNSKEHGSAENLVKSMFFGGFGKS